MRWLLLLLLISCVNTEVVHDVPLYDHTIYVEDGMVPDNVTVSVGDTVAWNFESERMSIVQSVNGTISAYTGFAGPKVTLASGIFSISPNDDFGFEEGDCLDGHTRDDGARLCRNEQRAYLPMQQTFEHVPDGHYIRLDWDQVNPAKDVYNWTLLDLQVEQAVKNRKVYSVSFRAGKYGTPDWIFNHTPMIEFQDHGSDEGKGCGSLMRLGNPTDDEYQKLYFELLRQAGLHLQSNGAWYRSLAYVKASGANLFTHENRLPKRCDDGCICNTQQWLDNGYTEEKLEQYYKRQFKVLTDYFPNKTISYQMIQAGFPDTDGDGYLDSTNNIIALGKNYNFLLQHNGLKANYLPFCGPCGNSWVLKHKGPTAWQTMNLKEVDSVVDAWFTLHNAYHNSNALFVEVYEEILWMANYDFDTWSQALYAKRLEMYDGDPYNVWYTHTFNEPGVYEYVDPVHMQPAYVIVE